MTPIVVIFMIGMILCTIIGIIITVAALNAFVKKKYVIGILYAPFAVIIPAIGFITLPIYTSISIEQAAKGKFIIPGIVIIIYTMKLILSNAYGSSKTKQ